MAKQLPGKQFKEIVDFAFDESQSDHERIQESMDLYKNSGYDERKWILGLSLPTKKSIDPKIRRSINRLIPAYTEQTPRIEIQPDDTQYVDLDIPYVEELSHWNQIMEELDNEAERLETMIAHNLVCGTAIAKSYYDKEAGIVRTFTVDPLCFAPDSSTSSTNFSNSQYLAHRTYRTVNEAKNIYPEFRSGRSVSKWWKARQIGWGWKEGIQIDELWMRPQFAKEQGVEIDERTNMVLATLVDGELAKLIQNPLLYPDFPFSGWTNFIDIAIGQGKSKGFWGTSNAENMKDQQKLLDEVLSSYITMARNAKTGRWLGKFGAFDDETFYNSNGAFLELPDGMSMDDVREIQATEPPNSLANLIQIFGKMVDEDAVSLNPVYTGEAPFGGASGRAISSLQSAAFNQITNNIRRFNATRVRMLRIRLNLIQQFANNFMNPSKWRIGLDLPSTLSMEARNIGFHLSVPNVDSLQATPAGKIQILSLLAEFGIFVTPEKLIDMLGLDTGYSITSQDLIQNPSAGQAQTQTASSPMQGANETEASYL